MCQLRPYQKQSIEDIRNAFIKGKRKILLVAPTGSGKTVVASEMIRRVVAGGKSCLFVAHRRELIMQCSNKLHDFGVNHGVLMADKSPTPMASCQVASIQTFTSRVDRDDFIKPEADLIIIDEAHRSASDSFKNLLREYPHAYVIGLTATPIRNDGRGLGNIYEKIVQCSTVKELTEKGYLVPNRIVAPTIPDLKGLKIIAGDYEAKGLDKKMNVPKLIGDVVTHWIKHANNRPTVVFCTSIKHSKYVSAIFNDNGIPAGHIDGEMPEIERETVLSDLRNGRIKVLSNCQILTEGFDCPKVSCVVLCRPTLSLGLYIQMCGRSLRIFPNKKDTLIIDHAGCVYRHGFIDDDRDWKLTMTKVKAKDKKIVEPIEKQPITCLECDGTVYMPTREQRACPNCGHIPTKKEQKILIKQGRLVEVPKEKIEVEYDKKDFYAELLYYSRQRGYNDGWASHVFKEKYKHFPYSKKIPPKITSQYVLNFIQHHNIKQAKSRNRKKNESNRADISHSERQSRGIGHVFKEVFV